MMEHPEALSPVKQALLAIKELQSKLHAATSQNREPVAIIGMGCRYPGAEGLAAFWQMLQSGVDATSEVPKDRWDIDALYDPNPSTPGKMTSRRGGFLKRLDEFDAAFFGISPREAPHVDPRQRIMLEIAWEALEEAGIAPDSLAGSRTGVFIATLTNDYDHLLFNDLRRADSYSGAGTANSIIANRLSYFLDLHGPSLALDTACSGSLVSVHLACESLRKGESTLAMAGGVNINLMAKSNVFFSRAGALSPEGRCRTFDQDADGIVRSDGAGVIVLKLLSDAVRDGDPVIAVIKGSAVNHDGRSNGIMAPNGEAQKAVLAEACRRADVSPGDIQYVEAHGTGTRLGDPIEVQALGAVLSATRPTDRKCILGSLKTNIGHSEAASGIGGLIKTALAIQHRVIPPTLHFRRTNPLVDFDALGFEVRTEQAEWPTPSMPLLAGVSGFGFGGTNAHVILAEAPAQSLNREPVSGSCLLPLSARTPEALQSLAGAYRDHLLATSDDAADICFTAGARRTHHACRFATAGTSREELATKLDAWLNKQRSTPAEQNKRRTVFVFSGQGSHWPSMGRDLYAHYPVFRTALDECDSLFRARAGWSVIEETNAPDASSRLNDTRITQPAIFSIQIALTALWSSWGITPDLVVGHSLGEAAAAHIAGVLSLEEAANIVYHRSRLMSHAVGKGKTAVVGLPIEQARLAIAGYRGIAVAGTNSPATSVLSGSPDEIAAVLNSLEKAGTFCRLIPGVDIAFHSPQMNPLRDELVAALAGLAPQAGTIPVFSSVTANLLDGRCFDAEYWGRNLREPFLFSHALAQIVEHGCTEIVEVSPHAVLSSAILQGLRHFSADRIAVLPSMRRSEPAQSTLFGSLAALYESGHRIQWSEVTPGQRSVVSLPSYPWQRSRYWFDQLGSGTREERLPKSHPLLGPRVEVAARSLNVWDTGIDAQEPAWLADHRVFGDVVLPGSACVEMALAVGRQMLSGLNVAVTEIVFERAMPLNGNRSQVLVTPSDYGFDFSLYSRSGEAWVRHATAKIAAAPEALEHHRVSLENLKARCSTEVATEHHYADMSATGLEYGPRFRAIQQLWSGSMEALAEVSLPAHLFDSRFNVHPVLLDAAFQTVAAALSQDDTQFGYLPAGLAQWRVMEGCGNTLWCHAKLRGEKGARTLEADIDLVDAEGRLVAQATGFLLKRTGTVRDSALAGSLLTERWIPQPLAPSHGPQAVQRWLLLADRTGVGEELASLLGKHGHTVTVALHGPELRADSAEDMQRLLEEGPSYDQVVHLWNLDTSSDLNDAIALGTGSALHLTQTVPRHSPEARLWFVTRGAQPVEPGPLSVEQSPVHGLALVIAQEYPQLQCTCVDLGGHETGAAELCQELLSGSTELRVAWRGNTRYAARIEHTSIPNVNVPELRDDSTYLITGGLGSLGLQTAKYLIQEGARHLLLTGRGGIAGKESKVAELEALGASVMVVQADIADPDDVRRMLATPMPPLRGVIHAAGVLDDGMAAQQSLERLSRVLAPKVHGAWNLHESTKDLPLDFFICFSSAASLVGSPGQCTYAAGNAFLDSLAHHRTSLGLPGLSINWGAWGEGGMAADAQIRHRMAARGVSEIEPAQGFALLSRILNPNPGVARFGVLPVDWTKFLSQFSGAIPSLFKSLAESSGSAPVAVSLKLENMTGRDERERILGDHVRQLLASVLGIDSPLHVPLRQRFFEMGMDSLTAVQLKNRLEATLCVKLPATLAFDHPTLEALTAHLGPLVLGPPEEHGATPDTDDNAELDGLSVEQLAALLTEELEEGAVNVR